MTDITGTTGVDTLSGTSGNDVISALDGNDTINGSPGTDTVNGGTGSDTFAILNLIGNGQISLPFPAGAHSYAITATGAQARGSDNVLVLDTQYTGIERVTITDLTADVAITVDAKNAAVPVFATLYGTANRTVTGSAFADTIYVGSGVNVIDGGAGSDYVWIQVPEQNGAVTIAQSGTTLTFTQGGATIDTVTNAETYFVTGFGNNAVNFNASTVSQAIMFGGGAQSDTLIGGSGGDAFYLNYATLTTAATDTDTITTGAGNDIIYANRFSTMPGSTIVTDFSTTDFLNFASVATNDGFTPSFIGSAAFTGVVGQYRFTVANGQTIVQFDRNGDGTADHTITLSNGAFLLAETFGGSNILKIGTANLVGTADADTLSGFDGADILTGQAGDDILTGRGGNDILYGDYNSGVSDAGGNDQLSGGAGDDLLAGGRGNDLLSGGDGNDAIYNSVAFNGTFSPVWVTSIDGGDDVIDGGAGQDTATLVYNRPAAITVDISNPDAVAPILVDGTAAGSITGIEALRFYGGAGNDSVTGGALSDYMEGFGGDDVLHGRDGADTIVGGFGDDLIDGGAGDDQAQYINATAGVHVDLRLQGVAQDTIGAGSDTLVGIESLSGSRFTDVLIGDDGANRLIDTGDGDDQLSGNGGADTLTVTRGLRDTAPANSVSLAGGDGNDTISFTSADRYRDTALLDGGDGDDTITGSGIGTGTITAGAGNDSVTIDMLGGTLAITLGAGSDTLIFAASQGNFRATTANVVTDFATGIGGDVLSLTNWINFGALTNFQLGGNPFADGHLRLLQSGSDTLLQVDRNGGGDAYTTLLTLQNTTATAFNSANLGGFTQPGGTTVGTANADTYLGTTASDIYYGLDGDDDIRGGAGDDALFGGNGNDLLRGGAGVDSFDGGSDDPTRSGGQSSYGDRVSFAEVGALHGAIADLRTGTITDDGFGNAETMVGIEGLGNGTAFADQFYGNDTANVLMGGRGDTLMGFGGDDKIQLGGAGIVDGGDGNDTLSLTSGSGEYLPDTNNDGNAETSGVMPGGWTVDLAAGTMTDGFGQQGMIAGIETIRVAVGSMVSGDAAANIFYGSSSADVLDGRAGDDVINGGGGSDTLIGGSGIDTVSYFNSQYDYRSNIGGVNIDLGAGTAQETSRAPLYTYTPGDASQSASATYTPDLSIFNPTQVVSTDQLSGIENVIGTDLADLISGDDGDNVIAPMMGNDLIDGRGGNDTLSYAAERGPVTVDLVAGTASEAGSALESTTTIATIRNPVTNQTTVGNATTFGADGYAATDVFINIENAIGTDFADTLIGNSGTNTLSGGGGDDILVGNGGNDILDGGAGQDVASIPTSRALVDVDVAANGDVLLSIADFVADPIGNVRKTVTLRNIEVVRFTDQDVAMSDFVKVGTAGDDDLTATVAGQMVFGLGGNDILRSGGLAQFLAGGDGNDTYYFTGAPTQTLYGTTEKPNGGTDTVHIAFSSPNSATGLLLLDNIENIVVDNAVDTSVSGHAGNDHIAGGGGNDQLGGIQGDDILEGNGGDDILHGDVGNDILNGGAGNDQIDGYIGNDIAVFNVARAAATITGHARTIQVGGGITPVHQAFFGDVIVTSSEGTDTLTDVETIRFTDQDVSISTLVINGFDIGDDVLTGTDDTNFIFGLGGNDTLSGLGGDDTLYGDAGNDILDGGNGNDTVVVNATRAQATFTTQSNGDILMSSPDGQDILRSIEFVQFTDQRFTLANPILNGTAGPDDLTATADGMRINGLDGNDILRTGSFTGTILTGGAGDDTYEITTAGWTIIEAANGGVDTIHLATPALNEPDIAFYYQLEDEVENLVFTSTDEGRLIGNALANRITGGGNFDVLAGMAGNDVLEGKGGDDFLYGGAGADTLDGGDGNDTVSYEGTSDSVRVDLTAGTVVSLLSGPGIPTPIVGEGNGDVLISIENVRGSTARDSIYGDAGANHLEGLEGSDYLSGGLGADTLDGGSGSDTVDYSDSLVAVQVNLATGINHGGTAEGDTLIWIEVVEGSAFDDTLTGGVRDDTLNGNDGDDLLIGGAGADTLGGGLGSDTVSYAASNAAVTVSLLGAPASGGDAQGDMLIGVENLIGSEFADVLTGSGLANRLEGRGGDDLLSGLGNADFLDGGSGNDTVTYEASATGVRVDLANGTSQGSDGDNDFVIAIENVRGSIAGDVLIGDSGANRIEGLDGADTLTGALGADTLVGGAGTDIFSDTKAGLDGDTILDFAAGDRIVISDATLGSGFTFALAGNQLTYTGGSLTLAGISAGAQIVASAAAGGGVELKLQGAAQVQNDFDGDGKSDILWRSSAQVGDWLATGNGNFAANPTLYGASSDWKIVGTGDFNGDGKSDLLWRNNDGRIGDWFGAAGGTFSPNATLTQVGNDWTVVGTGDFNGDGRADILWRHAGGNVGTWSADANGNFTANSTLYLVDNGWKIAGTGDFNGDGRSDILWRNTTTGQLGDWLANADGTLTANATLSSAPLDWHIAETGDFNGDGRADILWRSDAGQVGSWLADANGNFTPNATLSSAPLDWKIVEAGDYNGDGRTDILWRNTNSGQTGSWLADANGNFTPNASLYGAPLDWNVASDHAFLV